MQGLSISELAVIFKQSTSVCTDTRQLTKNALFFCLRGDSFNGNKFAKQAAQAGASKVVVDDPNYYDKERMILVNDCLKTLQELAQF